MFFSEERTKRLALLRRHRARAQSWAEINLRRGLGGGSPPSLPFRVTWLTTGNGYWVGSHGLCRRRRDMKLQKSIAAFSKRNEFYLIPG